MQLSNNIIRLPVKTPRQIATALGLKGAAHQKAAETIKRALDSKEIDFHAEKIAERCVWNIMSIAAEEKETIFRRAEVSQRPAADIIAWRLLDNDQQQFKVFEVKKPSLDRGFFNIILMPTKTLMERLNSPEVYLPEGQPNIKVLSEYCRLLSQQIKKHQYTNPIGFLMDCEIALTEMGKRYDFKVELNWLKTLRTNLAEWFTPTGFSLEVTKTNKALQEYLNKIG